MSDVQNLKLTQLVVTSSSLEQKAALVPWLEALLAIKTSNSSVVEKARRAFAVTADSKVILPILQLIAKELRLELLDAKKLKVSSVNSVLMSLKDLWSKQSLPAKLGISASALAMAIFGSQGAGIAALGTAIGVPLWIVFGAGGAWAGVVLEQLKTKN